MENKESRRDFMKKGALTTAGILGLSEIDVAKAAATAKNKPYVAKKKKNIVEKAKKIYSSPADVKEKYCGWTDITFWKGKYYVIFSRKNRHHPDPVDGPGLIVISSSDLKNWSEQQLADFSKLEKGIIKGDDRDSKIFATPDRLFAFNVPFPFDTYVCYTEDGKNWSPWK